MTDRFAGKCVIVTGGGNGIGAAISARFAEEGAAVVVADQEEAAAHAVAAEISANGGKACACHVDIRLEDQIETMLEFTRGKFGPAHVMINNAGVGSQKRFIDTPLETLRAMLEVNVVGTFLCAQAAAREMMKLGGGSIINFTSHSGLLGSTGRAAYAASKGGVIAMTRVMAVELAEHNIRVNAIAPGPIDVKRSRKQHTEERRSNWKRAVPLARYGEPHEIAGVATFLASEDASYLTGQTIAVDGGFTAAGLRVQNV